MQTTEVQTVKRRRATPDPEIKELFNMCVSSHNPTISGFALSKQKAVSRSGTMGDKPLNELRETLYVLSKIANNHADATLADIAETLPAENGQAVLMRIAAQICRKANLADTDFFAENQIYKRPVLLEIAGDAAFRMIDGNISRLTGYLGKITVAPQVLPKISSVSADKILLVMHRDSVDKIGKIPDGTLIVFLDTYASDSMVDFLRKAGANTEIFCADVCSARDAAICGNLTTRLAREIRAMPAA